jgi:broad specificity phosphatase PhoE
MQGVSETNEGSFSAKVIYLARHGRTELNAAAALRGLLDPPLDEVGRAEAEQLAAALAPFEPDLIVSSPLRRALETAWSVALELEIGVEPDDRLIDRDYGEWAGHPLDAVQAQWGNVDDAPGVEPRATVRSRALEALESVADRAESAAVVVAHDAINRLLLATLDPIRFPDADAIPQRTACFNVLYRADGAWQVGRVDVIPETTEERAAR